jgi:serine/threonine protein kinase
VKLCSQGTHKNIVALLAHGELPGMQFYFLDMELCDLDLQAYIRPQWKALLENRVNDLPPAIPDLLPILGFLQIRDIMRDITSGLAYIHSKGEVHRDIKPSNGILRVQNQSLNASALSLWDRRLETWRFRSYRGGNIEEGERYFLFKGYAELSRPRTCAKGSIQQPNGCLGCRLYFL